MAIILIYGSEEAPSSAAICADNFFELCALVTCAKLLFLKYCRERYIKISKELKK